MGKKWRTRNANINCWQLLSIYALYVFVKVSNCRLVQEVCHLFTVHFSKIDEMGSICRRKVENFVRCCYWLAGNNFRHDTVLDHAFRHIYINKFCNQFFSAVVFFFVKYGILHKWFRFRRIYPFSSVLVFLTVVSSISMLEIVRGGHRFFFSSPLLNNIPLVFSCST